MEPAHNETKTIEAPFERTVAMTKLRRLVRSRYGTGILALISATESLLPLPILTDPFLVTAVLVDRLRVWRLVLVTTLSSVVGGLLAYMMVVYFKDALLASLSPEIATTLNTLLVEDQGTFLLTLVGAITPIPYTVVAWAVALSGGHPLVFVVGSLIGRSFRYGVVGWCTYRFGPAALRYAQRSILTTSIVILLLFALYVWLKL
jgi:membrane protein YqaA with SNARE-associated domain